MLVLSVADRSRLRASDLRDGVGADRGGGAGADLGRQTTGDRDCGVVADGRGRRPLIVVVDVPPIVVFDAPPTVAFDVPAVVDDTFAPVDVARLRPIVILASARRRWRCPGR